MKPASGFPGEEVAFADDIDRVAMAIESRRRELIAQPLSRIYRELAKAAIESLGRTYDDTRPPAEFSLTPTMLAARRWSSGPSTPPNPVQE